MRKRQWKNAQAHNLDEAIQLVAEWAEEKNRRPAKVMADLMGVELKTYYRWLAESSMPLNRIRQFEMFAGCHFISEYLSLAAGKAVIDIPTGRRLQPADILDVQANFSEAMSLLVRHYQQGESLEQTVAAIGVVLSQLAWHRENVTRAGTPELDLFAGESNGSR